MELDKSKIDDAALALLYLTLDRKTHAPGRRRQEVVS